MGILDNYRENKRKKKLEDVNKALNQLKQSHPFDPTSLKPKAQTMQPQMTTQGKASPLPWVLTVLFIVVAGVVVVMMFGYKGDLTSLQDNYDAQKDELTSLQSTLDAKTAELDEMQGTLQDKTALELNLSDKTLELKQEKKELELEVENLEQQIISREAELLNLNQTNKAQARDIRDLISCVEDEFNGDLEDDCDID